MITSVQDIAGSAGPYIVVGTTLSAVWFVLRLVLHFQRDFTDAYAQELSEVRKHRDDLENRLDSKMEYCEKRIEDLEAEVNLLRRKVTVYGLLLKENGIEIPDFPNGLPKDS